MVPFVDQRLFSDSNVQRPQTFRCVHNDQYKHFRGLFPAKPLADFLSE